ncbi:hypothetical protein IVB27_38585 [Bradyrhizobium sp. 197]|uniref:hypothetical protein n=1 Tax=Bradyrhizobium sp. 197 TaxID=2782663 RepID=UPI001FFC041C|nr:hypothetical protein [Bradyrhizobium sp. 197]MCK1480487.1 hypothetical protein [Bradyrhizobium sp. 197]
MIREFRFCDHAEANLQCWLLFVSDLPCDNPYRTSPAPEPEPCTVTDIIAEIRAKFGDAVALSLRLSVH